MPAYLLVGGRTLVGLSIRDAVSNMRSTHILLILKLGIASAGWQCTPTIGWNAPTGTLPFNKTDLYMCPISHGILARH